MVLLHIEYYKAINVRLRQGEGSVSHKDTKIQSTTSLKALESFTAIANDLSLELYFVLVVSLGLPMFLNVASIVLSYQNIHIFELNISIAEGVTSSTKYQTFNIKRELFYNTESMVLSLLFGFFSLSNVTSPWNILLIIHRFCSYGLLQSSSLSISFAVECVTLEYNRKQDQYSVVNVCSAPLISLRLQYSKNP